MNRNPAVDQWLDDVDHPLDAELRLARDIILEADGFTDLDDLAAGRADLQDVVRAWCEWKTD